MAYCIPKKQASVFLKYLQEGKITPEKLSDMSPDERRSLFSEIVGNEDAKEMNAALESKLILKDQKRGMVTWLKQTAGLTEPRRRDLISTVEKLDEVLTPVSKQKYLGDLVSKRLGADVSFEEAKKISELAKAVRDAKAIKDSGGDRLIYGRADVALNNYVADLKNANRPTILENLKSPSKILNEVAGTAKGLNASLDNSAIFRQGWKTLFTNPKIWLNNSRKSFVDLVRRFGGKHVIDEVNAEIHSRDTFPLMQKAKLDVGTTEEQFPTHLPSKIPIIGRFYTASEAAYTGFVYRMRADIFDKYIKIAETAGIDIRDKGELESIGKLVNSLTGRGHLGAAEKVAGTVNNVFFSPRFLKSNIDFLTLHAFDKDFGTINPIKYKEWNFSRKASAENLVKVIAGTASVLAIASIIKPGSVELDPRSSNFGKIKIGNTTFDVSGGMASILTLAARLLTLSSKSALTGKVNKLNSGKYGAQTGTDVIVNFTEGKLSPAAGIMRDILKGEDYNGNKPTFLNEANNLFTPLPVKNFIQLSQAKNAPVLAGIIADSLGVSVNTIQPYKK